MDTTRTVVWLRREMQIENVEYAATRLERMYPGKTNVNLPSHN
jgi:hypothetical protein